MAFQLHLWVAVGALQEGRVAVTGELCYGLLVHAAVEKGRHKVVAEGVEVKLAGEAQLLIDRPQVLREGVGVDEASVVVREQVVA